MPNPFDRMFPGQATPPPPPELIPGQVPGLPAQYQNIPQGQFIPMPVGLPPDNPMAPPVPEQPLPGIPQQFQAPPGLPIPPQGLPPQAPVPPPPAQVPAPAVPGQPATAKPKRAPGPDMVQQLDKRSNQVQADYAAASAAEQEAIREGSQNLSQAKQGQAVERLGNAVQLADKQAEINKHNQELDAIDAQNLKQARDYTIPDFWKGREGARVGSTITVALAGIGAGLLGSTSNTAMNAIQHNIDQYFTRQKEKVDSLYKYAEQQGKLNTQTRFNYAQDLLNLKDQHSYVMAAAADRVDAVAIASKGAVDAAAAKTLSTKFREQGVTDMRDARELRSKINLQSAQAEAARGSAAESNARAKQGGYLTPAQAMTFINQNSKEIDRNFQEVTRKGGLNEEAHHLAQNIKMAREQPNNPAPFVGLLDSLVTAYSGGKVTQQQYNTWLAHIAPGADRFDQEWEKFRTGKPSKIQTKNLLDIAEGKYNGIRGELKEAHGKLRQIKEGPEYAKVPGAPEMLNRKELEIFGGSPGFGGKEPDLGLGQGQPGQGTTRVQLKDGTMAEFDASGKRVK